MAITNVMRIRSRHRMSGMTGWIVESIVDHTTQADELKFSTSFVTTLNTFVDGVKFTRSWCASNGVPDKIVVMTQNGNELDYTTHNIQNINDDDEIVVLMLLMDLSS